MESETKENEVAGNDMVKITREIIIERIGSCIVIKPNETVYLQTPSELVEALRERYDIDMRRDRKRLRVDCQMVEEKRDGDGEVEVAFHFKVTKLRGAIA